MPEDPRGLRSLYFVVRGYVANQVQLHRDESRRGACRNVELRVDVLDVMMDRALGDPKCVRDLAFEAAPGEQA